ncbi:hypothetical protein BDA99DRAFT_540589 [Phascolomyces articulosus]|uniref:Uncharacterized protein n=1 Tax=Phascolomyces articulosus TaxID=60185 RepID=A0AAD5JUE6_9FUNG|nr:hypothetical protein BDA99DRAFT_540589 [Phascolomyces articulosus]
MIIVYKIVLPFLEDYNHQHHYLVLIYHDTLTSVTTETINNNVLWKMVRSICKEEVYKKKGLKVEKGARTVKEEPKNEIHHEQQNNQEGNRCSEQDNFKSFAFILLMTLYLALLTIVLDGIQQDASLFPIT